MTVTVYWKGKVAIDRQTSLVRNGEQVGNYSETKIRLYDEHSRFLFNGHRIRAITIAGNVDELDAVLAEVADQGRTTHENVGYDLYKYLKVRAQGGGSRNLITYILSDRLYRANWGSFGVTTYSDEEINSRLLINEPMDTTLPVETIRWCQSAEEVAWLYCGFSQQCGFGVDVLDCATGEVTYHPYPTETVRQNIRRTLLDNLDRFFVRPIREEEVEELVYEF